MLLVYNNKVLSMFQLRCGFAVFCLSFVLIFSIFLRDANNRTFYQLCIYRSELSQAKQRLGANQLQLEAMLNPAEISQRLNESDSDIKN